ncbi:MAG TPA: hypothetical protein VMU54_25060 [Planctomycetota bacterium]|nr:hypothetical protein [Planctomycetota bacterium]
MAHLIRPPAEPAVAAANSRLNFQRCIRTLEFAVGDLLINFWHEPLRQRAGILVQKMSEGCKACGVQESSGLLRSLQALLSLSAEDTRGIQRSVAERLLELIGLLKEQVRRSPPERPVGSA